MNALVNAWQWWDGQYYVRLATQGYQPHGMEVVFFPLFPLLLRLTSVITGGNLILAGLVVNGIAYILAVMGLARLVRSDFGLAVANRTVLALSLFPSAFFLFAPYTEALFLALAVWTIAYARRSAWHSAALMALLVGLTRTQGALLAFPLAWEVIRWWRSAGATAPRTRRWLAIMAPLLPVMSCLGFLAYSQWATGWTALQAQRTWGFSLCAPWTAFTASARYIAATGDLVEVLNLTLALVFLGICVAGLWRLPGSYLLYLVPQLALIISRQNGSEPLLAMSRYLLVLFPAFVVVALITTRRQFVTWLALSASGLAICFGVLLLGGFVA